MKYSEESNENWRPLVSCRISVGMPGVDVPLLGHVLKMTLVKVRDFSVLQRGLKNRVLSWLERE